MWARRKFCNGQDYTNLVTPFFTELSSSQFQPIQQNATFHQPSVSVNYTQTSTQRRYTDIGKFQCPRCLKMYSYLRTLKRHLKLECGKEPQLQCPYCPKRTIYNANLKRHIFRVHSVRWLHKHILECLSVFLHSNWASFFMWYVVIVMLFI